MLQRRAARGGACYARVGQVQPQLEALHLLGVAADQLVGFGGLFPDHQFERVAPAVGAHAIELARALALHGGLAARAGLARG